MEYSSSWTSVLKRGLTLVTLFLILLAPVHSANADTPEPPEETVDETSLPQIQAVSSNTDEYGYLFAELPPESFEWIELQTAIEPTITVTSTLTQLGFNGFSDSIDVGYPFPFYENKYSQIRISKYGLLFFGDGIRAPNNQPIPFDTEPNNFIAPFWDNLDFSESIQSAIYYGQGTSAGEKIFVVEWKDLVFLGSNLAQTFQVILYEKGDILLQYKTVTEGFVNGCTVGIEDQQGTTGIQYIYNEESLERGLKDGTAFLITRPGPSPRVSLTPPFSSSFTENGTAWLELTIKNTGSVGTTNPSNYELSLANQGSWHYTFYKADGVTQLADADHDNNPETGLIAEGSYLKVKVKAEAVDGSQAGYVRPTLTATSYPTPSAVQDTMILQVAVPAAFMQAYSNNTRLWLGAIWSENEFHNNIELFPGYVFGVEQSNLETYLYMWEQGQDKFLNDNVITDYQNINYYILDAFGMPTPFDLPYRPVFNNDPITTLPDGYFYSRDPDLTHLDSGAYGVVWAQEHMKKISDTARKYNWNIEFALLSSEGDNSATGKIMVTSNTKFIGQDSDAPLYVNPQIQASGDLLFISWLQETYNLSEQSKTDVYYAVYKTTDNTWIKTPTLLIAGDWDAKIYDTPSLAPLNNSDVLVIYPEDTDGDGHSDKLNYQRIKSDGTAYITPQIITLADLKNVDSERLSNGNILVSWVDYTDALVHYTLFEGHDNDNNGSVVEIVIPAALPASYAGDYRSPQYVSITHDENGYAVLTWNVNSPSDYLYYALVDGNTIPSGARVKTPPMRYLNGSGVFAANSPQGIVPYGGSFRIFLPLVKRP